VYLRYVKVSRLFHDFGDSLKNAIGNMGVVRSFETATGEGHRGVGRGDVHIYVSSIVVIDEIYIRSMCFSVSVCPVCLASPVLPCTRHTGHVHPACLDKPNTPDKFDNPYYLDNAGNLDNHDNPDRPENPNNPDSPNVFFAPLFVLDRPAWTSASATYIAPVDAGARHRVRDMQLSMRSLRSTLDLMTDRFWT